MQQVGTKGFADAQLVDPRQLPVPVPLSRLPRRARLGFSRAWILHRKLIVRGIAAGIVLMGAAGLIAEQDKVGAGAVALYGLAQGPITQPCVVDRHGVGPVLHVTGDKLCSPGHGLCSELSR